MPEFFLDGKVVLHAGDCLEVLAQLPDDYFDSVVCDPPYGLEFMGKAWDKGVPGVEYWQAVFRVLKPGGHIVAFCGTRTYHRMVCAIEDAGFEVRDMIAWMYGSGFPKSLNVSKSTVASVKVRYGEQKCNCLDVGNGRQTGDDTRCSDREDVRFQRVTGDAPSPTIRHPELSVNKRGQTSTMCELREDNTAEIEGRASVQETVLLSRMFVGGTETQGHGSVEVRTRVEGETRGSEREGQDLSLLREDATGERTGIACSSSKTVSSERDERAAQSGSFVRLVSSQDRGVDGSRLVIDPDRDNVRGTVIDDYSGRQAAVARVCTWCGFPDGQWLDGLKPLGTALKPAIEPICLARKPLEADTVAGNVLKWNTGGLNIDGCRVSTEDPLSRLNHVTSKFVDSANGTRETHPRTYHVNNSGDKGRWPANVVHDGSEEVVDGFPELHGAGVARDKSQGTHNGSKGFGGIGEAAMRFGDEGSAARFFYNVKPDNNPFESLRPKIEPICLARKPLSEGTVAANVLKHGTGGLNVDGCRVETSADDAKAMDRCNTPGSWRMKSGGGLQGTSTFERSSSSGVLDTKGGRWPANVIHDGSSEVVDSFPETVPASASMRHNSAKPKSAAKGQEYQRSSAGHEDNGGSAARFFYSVKPDLDPICLARKPLSEGTVAANVLKHGTGGLNIDGCRVGTTGATKRSHQQEYPKLDSGAEDRSQHWARTGHEKIVGLEFGRWPANVVTDGSPEVSAAFPDTGPASGVGRKVRERGSRPGGFGNVGHGSGADSPNGGLYFDAGSAVRFFYTAKAGDDDRLGSIHPTVKPIDLMQWLIRLVTKKGGLVLDHFAGTGTTGEAAYLEGMRCELIERDPVSQEDIRKRMGLVRAGPRARKQATVKAKIKSGRVKVDDGPLFKLSA